MNSVAKLLHPQRVRRAFGAASCVKERSRFVANELRHRPALEGYQLSGTDLVAKVRHPLLDAWVLEEVFRFGVYEPPAQVHGALGALGRAPRIVDLGGHVGLFGLYVRTLFEDAAVTSFEPDPGNAELLRQCIEENGLQSRWRLVEACAAASGGTVEFASSFHLSRMAPVDGALDSLQRGIGEAFPFLDGTALTKQPTLRRVPRRDVFPFMNDADLVKMDIEGAEWEILADRRFSGIAATAIVLEYHPAYFSGPDAEGAVAAAFRRAGYVTEPGGRGPDGGTIWAWREDGAIS